MSKSSVKPSQAPPRTTIVPFEYLRTWRAMNEAMRMGQISEDEWWEALAHEKTHQRRAQFVVRIYGHANKLRSQREQAELV